MPTVRFKGERLSCDEGDVLRDVLLAGGVSPHNGASRYLNCRGHGLCGTCAVEVEGEVGQPTFRENLRLSLPPHDPESPLRLSCQTTVVDDVWVKKYEGLWGENDRAVPTSAGRGSARSDSLP